MAVSELEQRYTPLTESHAWVWQPWGPAGPYDIGDESDDNSEPSELTVPTRHQRRLQTWSGYTSHMQRTQYDFDGNTADDASVEQRSDDVADEETDTSMHGGQLHGDGREPADFYGGSASSSTESPQTLLQPLPCTSISSMSTAEVQMSESSDCLGPQVLWPSTPRDLPMRIPLSNVQDIAFETDEWVAQAWSRLDFEDPFRASEYEGSELSIFASQQQEMDTPILNQTMPTTISQGFDTQEARSPVRVCLSTEPKPMSTPKMEGCQYSSEAADRCHFVSECTHTTYPSETYGGFFASEVTDASFFSEGFNSSSKESVQVHPTPSHLDSWTEAASSHQAYYASEQSAACYASEQPAACYASEQSAGGAGSTRRDRHSRRSKKSKTSADAAKGAAQSAPTDITTLMVQNLPWSLSREELLAELDKGFAGLYDFCHVPRIFKTGKNQGFAFVNFVSQAAAERFVWAWHCSVTRFGMSRACKGLRVKVATIQGIEACKKISASKKMQRVKTSTFKPLVLPQPTVPEAAA